MSKLALSQFKVLSLEEEIELFQKLEINPGDTSVRERIIEGNLRLVRKFSIRAANSRLPFMASRVLDEDDLFQAGFSGLMRAIDKFNYREGNKFSTYATGWIKQAIQRHIDEVGSIIRLPVHYSQEITKYNRSKLRHTERLGREPGYEEMTDYSPKDAEKLERASLLKGTISLYASFGDAEDLSLIDIIPGGENPEEIFMQTNLRADIETALKEIDERKRAIIRRRFGIGAKEETLEQIGGDIGVSRERVRQIEREALKTLRSLLKQYANERDLL